MKTKIIALDLNSNEIYYLRNALHCEVGAYMERVAHAVSHGQDYSDIRGDSLTSVLEKIESL